MKAEEMFKELGYEKVVDVESLASGNIAYIKKIKKPVPLASRMYYPEKDECLWITEIKFPISGFFNGGVTFNKYLLEDGKDPRKIPCNSGIPDFFSFKEMKAINKQIEEIETIKGE